MGIRVRINRGKALGGSLFTDIVKQMRAGDYTVTKTQRAYMRVVQERITTLYGEAVGKMVNTRRGPKEFIMSLQTIGLVTVFGSEEEGE